MYRKCFSFTVADTNAHNVVLSGISNAENCHIAGGFLVASNNWVYPLNYYLGVYNESGFLDVTKTASGYFYCYPQNITVGAIGYVIIEYTKTTD